jgi:uncharacterized protein (TIGR02145 family)
MLDVHTCKKALHFCWLIAISSLFCTPEKNTITDLDGNTYHTVQIGNQTWMVENLRVTKFSNGDKITNVQGHADWQTCNSSAFSVYNNDTSLIQDYGLLYNWYAVNDERKIAPAGWRIPTEADVRELQQLILMNAEKKSWYLKEPSSQHWLTHRMLPTDTLIGFSALPGGYRDRDGSYHMLKSNGYYWLEYNSLELYHWSNRFFQAFADVRRDTQDKSFGFSVKCIKN